MTIPVVLEYIFVRRFQWDISVPLKSGNEDYEGSLSCRQLLAKFFGLRESWFSCVDCA